MYSQRDISQAIVQERVLVFLVSSDKVDVSPKAVSNLKQGFYSQEMLGDHA